MRAFSLLALISILASCGPTIVKNRPLEEIGMLAVLPTKSDPDIRRERVKYLDESLTRELESSGYSLINPDVVADICSNPDCPERKTLESRFGVSKFAQLDVSSASRANFIAGFYNNVGGKLTISDAQAQPFFSIEHSESERGGLIFQSGQIFKGIRETVNNYGDEKFSNLADQFIRDVVSKLPKANAKLDAESFFINDIKLAMRGGPQYDVCLDGSPRSTAKILVGGRQIGLREVQPGKYCNVIPLGWLVSANSESRAELRSPFGQSIAKPLDTVAIGICNPKDYVELKDKEIRFKCQGQSCAEAGETCQKSKFLVFSADTKAGPFSKILEVPWEKPAIKVNSQNVAIVAMSNDGAISLPVLFEAK